MIIEEQAKKILEQFPQIKEQPASISGRHHLGETVEEHLERCASVMRHLCDAFGIQDSDRDMLIASAYLHDMGLYIITRKGKIDLPHWKYYETGWSRLNCTMKLHPLISAEVLENYDLDRKKEIQKIVSSHMSHWYSENPQPETFYERLLVIADYLSTRKGDIYSYDEKRET